MIPKIHPTRRAWTACFSATACLAIFFVCMSVERYADDFYYATFLRDGLSEFLNKTKEHFLTFNGRVFVHIVAQVLLALGTWSYALAVVAMLWFIPTLAAPLMNPSPAADEPRRKSLTHLCFLLLVLLIGLEILREGLFWLSAACNYLLPFFLNICAAAMARAAFRDDKRPSLFLLVPAVFLCGATTELCGFLSVYLLAAMALLDIIRIKKWRAAHVLLPASALLGYLTIFLSPATRGRVDSESLSGGLSALPSRLAGLGELLFAKNGLILPVCIFFVLVFLASLLVRGFPKFGFGALPCAAAIVLLMLDGRPFRAMFIFTLYTVGLCIALFLAGRIGQALFLSAGLGGASMMALTASAGPRTMLPFALALCLIGAFLAAELLELLEAHPVSVKIKPAVISTAITGVLAALALAIFSPIAVGYAKNAVIRGENASHIKEARKTGVLHYRIDYDKRFTHTLMYDDGYFFSTFLECYGLAGDEIYLESVTMTPIFAAGGRMTSPAYREGDDEFFPIENIITALGGSCAWTPQQTVFTLDGREIVMTNREIAADGRIWSLDGERATRYYTTCLSERILSECFGIGIFYDEEEAVYVASLLP